MLNDHVDTKQLIPDKHIVKEKEINDFAIGHESDDDQTDESE